MPQPADAAWIANRRRWITLTVVCLAMLMNALDGSIVNVALPAIQRDLHFQQADLAWVVDAYLITFGSFLLLAGRLGDLIGRKRVFLAGVAIFTVSSAVCAAAPDQAVLISARFVQGLGGAVSSSVIIAIIVTEFTGPAERAKAMSAYILVAISGGSLGLLAGGVLTEAVSWRWIFIINLPIGAATMVLGKVLIAEDAIAGGRRRIDIGGSLFVTASVLLGTYAIIEAPTYGWGALRTIGTGAAAIALLGVFVAWEARVTNPIMPFRILRLRSLCSSGLVRAFVASGMFAVFFLGALYLEHVLGYSPLRTGLAFMPLTVGVAVMSSGVTSRLMNRFGALAVMLAGMGAVIAGLLLLARAGAHASYWPDLFPAFLVFGVGGGATFTPLLSIAMADVPSEDAGLASGIVNVSMQLGAAIGLALLGTIAADRTAAVAGGRSQASALLSGYDLAFVVAAGGVAFAMGAAGVLLAGASRRLLAPGSAAAADTDDPTGVSEIGVVIEI